MTPFGKADLFTCNGVMRIVLDWVKVQPSSTLISRRASFRSHADAN
jgi:hypothetical protein